MIELITFPKVDNPRLRYYSPFCTKAEAFLKLAKVDYKVTEFNGDPGKFENGKLPALTHDGNTIVDSHFMQKYVEEKFDVNLDSHLSEEDKARGFMAMKVCEEYIYWTIVHERWFIDSNFERLKTEFFSEIPALFRGFATGMIRKGMRKSANGHGIGRHSDDKVLGLGKEGLRMLSAYLGDRPFITGDKVSSYDTSVFGTVSSVIYSTLGPELQAEVKKHDNLIAYDERMYNLVFA